MGTTIIRRAPRAEGPPMPSGELELAEPPVMNELASADKSGSGKLVTKSAARVSAAAVSFCAGVLVLLGAA